MTTRLTDKFILSIRPAPGERPELYDLQEPGLLLRVTAARQRTWYFRYRLIDGSQPRLKLGSYPSTSIGEARRKAQAARTVVERGEDPAALERKAEAEARSQVIRSYSDLVAAYFTATELGSYRPRGRPKKTRTIEAERRLYERHVKKPLGRLPIAEITRREVKEMTRGMLARGITTQSNHAQAFVRQTFSFALDEELVAYNPIMGMRAPAPKKARERMLDDQELKLFWQALDDHSALEDRNGHAVTVGDDVVIALKLTALLLQRRIEVATMRVADLDLAQGIWTLPGDFVKNGRAHLVPLPSASIALIERALRRNSRAGSPYLFPSPRDPSQPIHPDALTRAMGRLVHGLGLPLAGPHDLRRTGATLLSSERGEIPPFVISQVLNHTTDAGGGSATTRRHYNLHLYAKEKRHALTTWETLLLEIVGERVAVEDNLPMRRSA